MKRKLLVTLVASALELYAATASAQTVPAIQAVNTCAAPADAAGNVHAGQGLATGPFDPTTYNDFAANGGVGYPTWVSGGVSLQRCLVGEYCALAGNPDPSIALSLQANSADESFWWVAVATIAPPIAGFGSELQVEFAAEGSFLGGFTDGNQITFTRMRVRGSVPEQGRYTLVHPYGIKVFDVTASAIGADGRYTINETTDVFFTPNKQNAPGVVGPLLTWDTYRTGAGTAYQADPGGLLGVDNSLANPPTGYVGDGIVPHAVVGSPCGTDYIQFFGTSVDGTSAINMDGQGFAPTEGNMGSYALVQPNFVVIGQLSDKKPVTAANIGRLTYSRSAVADTLIDSGRDSIDAWVQSPSSKINPGEVPTARTVKLLANDAALGVGTSRLAVDRTLGASADGLNNFGSEILDAAADPDVMPKIVALQASTNQLDVNNQPVETPVTFYRQPIDQVVIESANYNPGNKTLTVLASSSDKRNAPALTVYETQTAPGTPVAMPAGVPYEVTVQSAAGGSDTAKVTVLTPEVPAVPSDLQVVGAPGYNSVTLQWADNSINETSFIVTRTNGTTSVSFAISRNPAESAATSVVSYTDTAAAENTTYTYTVRAANALGASSESLPVLVTTAIQPMVVASGLTAVSRTNTSITVSWTDGSPVTQPGKANETGYRVIRINPTGAVGSTDLLGANSTNRTVTPLTANIAYRIQVIAFRTVPNGGAEQTVDLGTVNVMTAAGTVVTSTPTAAAVTQVAAPVFTFNRASTTRNETGFRVTTTPIAINASTGANTDGVATLDNLAPTAAVTGALTTGYSKTLSTLTAGNLYAITAAALNLTVPGNATARVYTVPGGIGAPLATSAVATVRKNGNRFVSTVNTIRWTAPSVGTNAVSGYRVEYCRAGVTATSCTTWATISNAVAAGRNTLSVTHDDNRVTNQAGKYFYRITPLAAPSALTGAVSNVVSVVAQ